MEADKVDYSLYLVTDSTPAILGDRDLIAVVEAAVEGGVTVVQYRDKVSDTADLILTARKLHAVTCKYNVPLLINDRIDVALAVGCEGVHLGQDDIDLHTARNILGDSAIIGVTVGSIEQAESACRGGATYLGIGTVFGTPTSKTNTKNIIGTAGIREILKAISSQGKDVRTVCIGGINVGNVQRVLYQSSDNEKKLDGVAVVSAIIAAKDTKTAAQELRGLISKPPPFNTSSLSLTEYQCDVGSILQKVPSVIKAVGEKPPLSHNMTNLVVQNFAANVALAIGASPIMANYGQEAADLCKLGGSLVINMGTVTPEGLQNYLLALQAYNLVGGPVVFDPVGAGATAVRRASVQKLMAGGYFDVIKGNEGEIKIVAGEVTVQQRGVDSGQTTMTAVEKATLVRDLASRERNVVVMTGTTDYASDGERTFAIRNGHDFLGKITGSGCVLGTIMSAMLAVHREDKLLAAISGLLHYEIAAEKAAARDDVKGPGTFVPALIDELYIIKAQTSLNNFNWLSQAKIEALQLE